MMPASQTASPIEVISQQRVVAVPSSKCVVPSITAQNVVFSTAVE
jgi:hypothetical protein